MGKFRVPSDMEIQALLDKEQAEREKRNLELLGAPTETMQEVQFRKAALLKAGEMNLLESEEIHEAEIRRDIEASEEDLVALQTQKWERIIQIRQVKYLILIVATVLMCGMCIRWDQWVPATGNFSLIWGWLFFYWYWKNCPHEVAKYDEHCVRCRGFWKFGMYFCIIGISTILIGFWLGFILGFIAL